MWWGTLNKQGLLYLFLIIGFHFSNLLDKNVSDINGMSHKVFLDAVIASIPKVDSNLKKSQI